MTSLAPDGARAADLPAFRRDRTTVLLYAALGLFGVLQTVPGAITPALRQELGYGYTTASLHITAYALGSTTAALSGPWLDRRLGRHRLLTAGVLGMALACAAFTVGRAAPATLLAAYATGLCGTAVILVVQGGLSDHHGERRSAAFSESNALCSLGTTLGPLAVGAAAAGLGSWRLGVLVLAALAVPLATAWRATAPPAAVVPAVATTARRVPLPRAARAGVAFVFASVLAEWWVAYWGATYLRDVVALPASAAVAAMAVFFGAMLTGRALGGVLARRLPVVRIVAAALLVAAAGVAVQATGTAAGVALAGLLLLGLGISVLFPLGLALSISADPARATLVGARCLSVSSGAILLGPLAVGRLADAVGLRAALVVLPVAVVAAGVALTAHARAARP